MRDDLEENISKLNKTDKLFLKYIIEQGRSSDSDVAKAIGITPQAVVKIRTKMDEKGITKGYRPKIDYKKVGINYIALAIVKFLPGAWEHYTDKDVSDKIKRHAYIIFAAKTPTANESHILLLGFKDAIQMSEHFTKIKTKLSKILEIKNIYTFPIEDLIKDSCNMLLDLAIEDKDFNIEELFKDNPHTKRDKLIL